MDQSTSTSGRRQRTRWLRGCRRCSSCCCRGCSVCAGPPSTALSRPM